MKKSILITISLIVTIASYAQHDNIIGWDGKFHNKFCEQGVYIYQVEIKAVDGQIINRIRHVTLLSKVQ